jgi:hypothetical protein
METDSMSVTAQLARVGAWRLTAGLAFLPQIALACPACAGRGGLNIHTALVLAAMISVPFLIAGAVVHIVRRIESETKR